MHIWLRLFSACAQQLVHLHKPTPDSKIEIFAWFSNIYRWKIYLWHVRYALRKTQRLKCINNTNIFAVCHGGLNWSIINIKGWLRINVHKLVWLCELILSFITALVDWFIRLFKVRFWTWIPAFPLVSVLLWFVIFTRSSDERTRLRNSFERRNQSTYKILVTDYWSLSKQ